MAAAALLVAGLALTGCAHEARRYMAACHDDDECASGMCWNSHCTAVCTSNADCGEAVCVFPLCTPYTSVTCSTAAQCGAVAHPSMCQQPACVAGVCGWTASPAKPCTTGVCTGVCQDSTCVPNGTACADGDPCTTDTCSVPSGCQHDPASGACDDGNPCTSGEQCAKGVCGGGTVKPCDDGNPCTVDSCFSTSGCQYLPIAAVTACTPSDPCLQNGICSQGTCVGSPVDCSDGLVCTDDGCSSGKCTHTAKACEGACAEPTGCICPSGTVAIPTHDKTVCALDFPAWGVRPLNPSALFVDNGDGTVTDSQTKRIWAKQLLVGDGSYGIPPHSLCTNLQLAGKNDWRLPSVAELSTLFSYQPMESLVPSVFQQPPALADTAVSGQMLFANVIWQEQGWGGLKAWYLPYLFDVACVRQAGPSTPTDDTDRFVVDEAAGTVFDKALQRTWQRDGSTAVSSLAAAKPLCPALALDGGSWRLPTVVELAGLVSRQAGPPMIDAKAFGGTVHAYYVSSTVATSSQTGEPWLVGFQESEVRVGEFGLYPNATVGVRCIR